MEIRPALIDPVCGRRPDEIAEYLPRYTNSSLSAADYVWHEEGTLDAHSGHFVCTECYLWLGSPAASFPDRWVASPAGLQRAGWNGVQRKLAKEA